MKGLARNTISERGFPTASLKKRGSVYYLFYYCSGREVRRILETDSLQIAKERRRQYVSAELRGVDNPLPTRTLIADALT